MFADNPPLRWFSAAGGFYAVPVDAYTFALAWRWTQPSHNVLPPEVMAQIAPLEQLPDGLLAHGAANSSTLRDVRSIRTDGSAGEVVHWLGQLPVDAKGKVIVRWTERVAVETTWSIFTRFWDDFCYPSSDDVEVYPASGDWILLYHHYELFEWGCRKRG